MTGAEIIKSLWDFVMTLMQGMSAVWSWLNTAQYIGLKIDLLGIDWGISFIPMYLTGGVLIVLLGLALIKTFIPVA